MVTITWPVLIFFCMGLAFIAACAGFAHGYRSAMRIMKETIHTIEQNIKISIVPEEPEDEGGEWWKKGRKDENS